MFALLNIIQDQIINEFLFLTGLKVSDITIVCYVTFDYVTTDAIDCLHFDTLYGLPHIGPYGLPHMGTYGLPHMGPYDLSHMGTT